MPAPTENSVRGECLRTKLVNETTSARHEWKNKPYM